MALSGGAWVDLHRFVSPCNNPAMCGRVVQSQPASVYAKYFDVDSVA